MTKTHEDLLKSAENDLDMILGYYSLPLHAKDRARLLRTTTAIKEALKEPDQEPVAWICHQQGGSNSLWWDKNQALDRNAGHKFTPLYTAPPPSPWVWLTRDEKRDIINSFLGEDWVYAVDAIEQALKEKNHG